MLTFAEDDKIEVMEFNQWLQAKLDERGWSPTRLAAEAGLGNSTITRILAGTRKAGKDACLAIAEALGEHPDDVFKLAGILPTYERLSELSRDEEEVIGLYRELKPSQREALMDILKGLVDREKQRQQQ